MDRIMAPKDACALIPGPCEYPTDGMKAAHQLALRRGDYPGVQQAQGEHRSLNKGEGSREVSQEMTGGCTLGFEHGGSGHKLRNAGGF